MSEPAVLTAAEVRRRLAALPVLSGSADPRGDPAGPDWDLRASVAFLDAFSQAGLAGLAVGTAEQRTAFVLADCERAVTADGGRWRLRDDVRLATVRWLAPSLDRMRALAREAATREPGDIAARLVVRCLDGHGSRLDDLAPAELAVLLRVCGWLAGVPGIVVPSAEQVRSALAMVNLLQPLRNVADGLFVGRETELAQLERFAAGPGAPWPVLLHGPGGVGKSTLLGHFLLTRVVGQGVGPLVYLSFDHAELRPDRPLSLLGEAARQLAVQLPDRADQFRDLSVACLDVQRFDVSRAGDSLSSSRGSQEIGSRSSRDEQALLARFASVAPPARLWVLDTFERAQRRGDAALDRLWTFFGDLSSAAGGLRIVVAGRSAVHGHPVVGDVALTGLDGVQARELLARELAGAAVPGQVLDTVVEVVQANPLSLRLAARFLRTVDPADLVGEEGRRRLLEGLQADQVQGVLYRRVLDHLDDPDVRALANPGLALRRVTPEVIRFVLARPCGLGPLDEREAQRLFDLLAGERLLVERQEPGVLVHRADVRAQVLPLLRANDPGSVDEINRLAVGYYADQPGQLARTEELYHRLALGQSSELLDRHWDRSVEHLLQTAMDELPQTSRAYLAERLELSAGRADLAAADDATWMRQVQRQARAFLDDGRPLRALELVRSRALPHPYGPLVGIEAEALTAVGNADAAAALVEQTLGDPAAPQPPAHVVSLAMLGARLAQDRGDTGRATALYAQAQDAAESVGDPAAVLAASVGRLRIQRLTEGSDSAGYQEARREVASASQWLDPKQRAVNPSLVRELAAEVGSLQPELLVDAVRLNGLDVIGEGADLLASEGLGKHVEVLRQQVLAASVVEPEGDDPDAPDAADAADIVVPLTSAEQAGVVADYLEAEPGDTAFHTAVEEVYRQEVDREAFTYRR